MNKKLLAAAVALTMGAVPVLASANATLSGVLGYRLDVVDGKVAPARTHDLQVRGSEDLGNGLTGLYQFALTGVGITNDASFVGLRGGFGTVLLGRLDHPYRSVTNGYRLFGDTVATGSFGGERAMQTLSRVQSDNAVAYVSNNFSGFSFSGAVVPQTSATATERSNEFPFSLSMTYSQGPLVINAAYEDLEGAGGAPLYNIAMVGGRYTLGDLMIGLMYEQRETNVAASVETTRIIVPVSYRLSPSLTLLATIMDTDRATGQVDTTDYALGLNYALSSRTSIKAAFASSEATAVGAANPAALVDANSDETGFSVFVRHGF
jgi:predicted porin